MVSGACTCAPRCHTRMFGPIPHVDAWDSEGGIMSPELTRAASTLKRIPRDDSIAEEPHARAARIADRGRRAECPWRASSMRITSHIQGVRDLASGDYLKRFQTTYKIQLRVDHRCRNPKLRRLDFLKRFVHSTTLVECARPHPPPRKCRRALRWRW